MSILPPGTEHIIQDAGIVGAQGRDEYSYDDCEQYFNYMVSAPSTWQLQGDDP